MNKNKVVIFDTDNYARIFINPSDEISSLPGALLNPDLSNVINISPEYWKLDNNSIVSMSEDEKIKRDEHLADEAITTNAIILEKFVHKEIEKIVEVVKYVDIIKEVPVEITKFINKEVPVYTEKYINVPVVKFVEVIKDKIPKWVFPIIGLQSLVIAVLLLMR